MTAATTFQHAAPPAPDDMSDLVAYLRDRDAACPLCGYNLRGLTSDRCPECGRELRLSVGLTEPYLRAWALLAFAAFGGGGVGLFFGMLILRAGWPDMSSRPFEQLLINASLFYFMLSIPLAVVVLLTRRRFVRLPQARQWLIAWAVTGLTAAAMGVFGALVR